MLLCRNKYLYHFMQKTITALVFLLTFSTAGYSQNKLLQKDTILNQGFNPIFIAAYKKPYTLMIPHTGDSYRVYWKRSSRGLMYWPNYPLTAAQIEARDRKYDQSLGQQIISSIAESYINSLLYGKKMPAAVTPKF